MREELANRIINTLMPYVDSSDLADINMKITIILSNYDIGKIETELTVYEGDINEQILKRFLMSKIASGRSARTVNYYKSTNRHFFDTVNKPYMDITADDIRLYLAVRVHRDGVTKTTANNERRCISSFYQWLQKEEILLKNPMSKVETIKVTKQKKLAFTQMELEQIRYACRTARETAIIETLLSTWCRVTELSEIKVSDIKDDGILVHGKGDKYRTVYLNAKAQMAIKVYLNERKDNNPYLLPRARYAGDVGSMTKNIQKAKQPCWYQNPKLVDETKGMDVGSIESIVREIGRRANVKNTHPHRFRRTGATIALRSGMPLMTVSKLLGHESIGTTQIYLDISDKELEQAHEKYVI